MAACRARLALFHEVIARSKRVVEDVCLSKSMPAAGKLPKLPAASQVGHGVDAPALKNAMLLALKLSVKLMLKPPCL